ncbi:MAG TPA: hypothetical protein PKN32_07160 [Bacteroidales bacterium]|nr:hypothetical protein [Bacteroidales bacterium]
MKRKIKNIVALFLYAYLSYSVLYAQDTNSAVKYNDEMMKIQTSVDDALGKFVGALDAFDNDLMKIEKENSLKAIKKANKDVSAMGKFDGTEYKKEMKVFLKMYKEITENDLTKIMNLIIEKGGDLTGSDWDAYDSYFESALMKYDDAFNRFNKFQYEFATKWGFTVGTFEEEYEY